MEDTRKTEKVRRQLRRLIFAIAITIIITLLICIIEYSDNYDFWNQYISHLGQIRTFGSDIDNSVSRWIFAIGFVICGILCFWEAILYLAVTDRTWLDLIKSLMCFFMVIGVIGIVIPADAPPYNTWHEKGAFLFIGSFGIFDFFCQFFKLNRDRKKNMSKRKIFDTVIDMMVVIALLTSCVIYIVIYSFRWMEFLPLWQKIILLISTFSIFMLDLDDM